MYDEVIIPSFVFPQKFIIKSSPLPAFLIIGGLSFGVSEISL